MECRGTSGKSVEGRVSSGERPSLRRILMKSTLINRMIRTAFIFLLGCAQASAQTDPLPSWNDGAAKKAIVEFVKTPTEKSSPQFVPPEARIATFDQDGTTWVQHPMYTQIIYCLVRVPGGVGKKPDFDMVKPCKTGLAGNGEAVAKFTMPQLEMLVAATLTGMSVEDFKSKVRKWLASAENPRCNRLYTALTYQPMLEVM